MILRIALALDLLLTAIAHLFPSKTKDCLPLGGSPFVQLAVLVLLAVAIGQIFGERSKRHMRGRRF
jgi:hypothetical protein